MKGSGLETKDDISVNKGGGHVLSTLEHEILDNILKQEINILKEEINRINNRTLTLKKQFKEFKNSLFFNKLKRWLILLRRLLQNSPIKS